MALNDKITAILDASAPAKERLVEVKVSSPGGEVFLETFGDHHIKIVERTRKGHEKSAVFVAREHVVLIRSTKARS